VWVVVRRERNVLQERVIGGEQIDRVGQQPGVLVAVQQSVC